MRREALSLSLYSLCLIFRRDESASTGSGGAGPRHVQDISKKEGTGEWAHGGGCDEEFSKITSEKGPHSEEGMLTVTGWRRSWK